MMKWWSREEALLNLFYNITSLSSTLLLFHFLLSSLISHYFPFFHGDRAVYGFSEEEEEAEAEEEEVEGRESNAYYRSEDGRETDLVADIVLGGEALLFYKGGSGMEGAYGTELEEEEECGDPIVEVGMDDDDVSDSYSNRQYSAQDSFGNEGLGDGIGSDTEEEVSGDPRPDVFVEGYRVRTHGVRRNGENVENGRKYGFKPSMAEETKKFGMLQRNGKVDVEEIYGESCMVRSTSKSSSKWRSSITCGTDEPFSFSSRRSCPKWESYTLFQKYDEEMMFLDRISAQKLYETESLRSIQVCPRSISERIILNISTINQRPSDVLHNPYGELEAAYVAQICLTWEALNWTYKNFQSKRATEKDFDCGCPAHIAQQFQQFQVLLQRYIENEPYEQGRRPEVYARMRLLAPKLLQVPEYRDPEDEHKDGGFGSRISSASFAMIIEDGIRTFMRFLKIDKERPCHKLAAFFKRKRQRNGVDPVLISLVRKVNHKKKGKVKDMRRAKGCMRKRRLRVEEESTEVLMALIDLKVVSRVLRMREITEEQLHWCEEKMSRVKILQGKLQRDPTPLFFPAHLGNGS
ncbi:hypothetical protein MLD38_029690 [Melastoma candidum]|uniref:Uncharacterized protein n=1 Tax=Melastoma candidum TaxID=119954 RepID=A0ACB9NA45_9MYRT|nr:hypothetical protein MLD38_029690 [Melastoma candidum]